MKKALLLAAILLLAPGLSRADEATAIVDEILDAGTLRVEYNGNQEILRLIGIDVPESDAAQESGSGAGDKDKDEAERVKATDYIGSFLFFGNKISLEFDIERRDRRQRLLAYAYLDDGTMLNYTILYQGYARPLAVPPNVKYSGLLRRAYEDAFDRGRGLWKYK